MPSGSPDAPLFRVSWRFGRIHAMIESYESYHLRVCACIHGNSAVAAPCRENVDAAGGLSNFE